jgi:hypothetical protein
MEYSERLSTRLNPLAEGTCFSQGCGALADVAIPASVTAIGAFAFNNSGKQYTI